MMKSSLSNIQFVVQSIAKGNKDFFDEEEKFQEKLVQLSENIYACNLNDAPPPVKALQQHRITDCAVGPEHLAFLLEDGRVCRLWYTANTKPSQQLKTPEDDHKDVTSQSKASQGSKSIRTGDDSPWNLNNTNFLNMGGAVSWTRWGNRIGVIRSTSSTAAGSSSTSTSSSRKTARMSQHSAPIPGANIRLIRSGQVRGRNIPLLTGSQRVMVPASQVPEDLINQVQGVLQGKSRNVIVRELQRTNLDVNLAVNNLLSRDDEDNDELDDAADYIPGEELMSLLDGGMHPGDHPRVVIDADSMLSEDLLGYSFSRGPSSRGLGGTGADRGADPEEDARMSSPHWIDLFRRIDAKRQSKAVVAPLPGSSGISLGQELEWWEENGEPVHFNLIGAMHSELVGVDTSGVLRQWKWKDVAPFCQDSIYHPSYESLCLPNKKITLLSTCSLRASVLTQGGATATWMDESVASYTRSLHQPLTLNDAIESEKVKSLHVCSLYTAVLTQQGNIYWWGVPPFNQRKKLLEKAQNSLLQNLCKDNGTKSEPVVGSTVCLRHFPIYQAGTIAVNISSGTPKVGKLLESAWNLEKSCRFQIINGKEHLKETQDKGTDPSQQMQSGVSSDEKSLSESSKPQKRKRESDEDDKTNEDEDSKEEEWDLKEVVFIEDVRSVSVGKVTKIDGSIVAVDFSGDDSKQKDSNIGASSSSSSSGGSGGGVGASDSASSLLNSCRLLHKDDIVVVKPSSPHVVDCIQKQAKKMTIHCDPKLQLHCITATTTGIVSVASKPGGRVSYISSLGKQPVQKVLPTSPESFMAVEVSKEQSGSKQSSNPSLPKCKLLHCDQASPTLLQDYNAMLYPLLADENEGIRDPLWADIPPLLASAMGIHSTSPHGNRCTVTVLAFQNQVLMPLVMQRDFPAFESIVKWVEGKHPTAWAYIFCKSLLTERCDGQRNLLHMCIEMSIPSSNKEQKEDEKEKEARTKPKYFDNAPTSVSSAASKAPPLPPLPPPPVSEPGVFMSDDDRAHAVNAIANVLSTVTRGHIGASAAEMPIQSVGRYIPSQPPGVELPPSSSSTSASASRRPGRENPPSSSALGEVESPLLPWPPEMKAMDAQSEEEGMNLSMSSAEKKSARRSHSSSTTPTSSSQWTEVKEGGKARGTRYDAVSILELICKSKASQPSIKTLLTQKDAAGCTPFMFAVAHRAYVAALVIFNAALDISKEQESSMEGGQASQKIAEESLLSMIFPQDSDPDYNPLYMLCCNDNCSFTWTGAQHINQDIFECLTCGLTETLCCCSECARVCHKGHECKLKRTSPTAYCDCWEKCACKSLVSGDAADRIALLRNLLHLTQLYEVCDSGGQHILQFLIQTVARQVEEQRQWRPRTARMSAPGARPHRVPRPSGKEPTQGGDQDMPEHDLHPPRFCREALLLLLGDWKSVRSLVLTGSEGRRDELSMSSRLDARNGTPTTVPLLPEDEQLLRQQSGTARLDQFTHTLLVKCASYEYLDKLLETLIHTVQLNKGSARTEGVLVARRFLRSVIRVYVILTAQSTPDRMSAKSSFYNQPTSKCARAFLALTPIAIEELCELAESLIAPVRMGVARPTTSFQLLASNADVVHGSTAAFSRQPFPPRSAPSDDDDDPSGRPGTSGLSGTEPGKSSLKRKKAKKRSKRITVLSHRYGSGRRRHAPGGADDGANEEEDQHQPDPPQDTQETQGTDDPVEDDPLGDSDHNESDMDLTDIEIIAETDSDSVASGDSDQGQESEVEQGQIGREASSDQADIRRNNDPSQERDLVEEEDEYDTEPMADDPRDAKTPTNQQPHPHQEDEDTDSDHYQWQEEGHLERQPTRQLRTESRQTPHTMQWAMGGSAMAPSKPPRPSGGAPGGGRGNPLAAGSGSNSSGILYVDRRSMRRSENLENAYINSILDRRYAAERIGRAEEPQVNSAAVTNAQLARLFAACVREVSHLLSILRKGDYLSEAPLNTVLEVSFQEWKRLQGFVRSFLSPTWSWLLSVVESTEYQLRYGQVLSMASNPSHREHPHYNGKGHHSSNRRSTGRHHAGSGAGSDAARQDFLGYALSLMRARSDEHSDLLPMVDVMALQHVAYVLDAYVYYLRGCSYRDGDSKGGLSGARGQISLDIGYDNSENEEDEDDDFSYNDNFYSVLVQGSDPPPLGTGTSPGAPGGPMTDEELNQFAQPQGTFFRRSESMTFLGCSDPNTFEIPLPQALPLAEKPHLLQPTARKEELFGRPRSGAQHPRHQLSSMSLTQRSSYDPPPADSNNSGSDDPQSSIGRPNLPPPEKSSRASRGQAPPPPYSSVIRSTSSFIEKSDPDAPSTSSSSSGKDPDPVAMETVSAPGAAVTVDVTSSCDNVTAETEVATNSTRGEAQSVDDDADDDVATAERVLGKSRLTLELFSRVFLDDVGGESKSILQELGGFEVREAKFRKGTERIRTSQTVDLQLHVERCRLSLIQQTFKSLNQHFKRRCGSTQPMAVLRVKVLFKDEPGEGTGVARSYYTAIAEALLSSEPLPSLDGLLPGTSSSSSRKSTTSMHPLVAHLCKREREDRSRQGGAAAAAGSASSTAATTPNHSSSATTGSGRSSTGAEQQINLRSFLTARYRDRAPRRGFSSGSGALTRMTTTSVPYHRRALSQRASQSSLERSKQAIGERLYPKVAALHQTWAPKITGMLLGLPAYELLLLLRSELALQERVSEAVEQLVTSSYNPDAPPGGESRQETSGGDVTVTSSEFRSELLSGGEKSEEKTKKVEKVEEPQHESLCGGPPLFYQPGKRGFYAPTSWGEMTEARQNAFRNVGRIIGLCLLQNELCPLPLCRHVLKVILGRKVNWHDLAFFDPVLYESLRQLVLDAEGEDGGVLEELELTFQVDLQSEEGGRQVSLIADGATTSVTRANVRDYVRRYALQRMVVCCRKPLEKLRQGVLDVLPRYVFQALTAEDLRLLVNGCGHVDVRTLISYTLFNDESGKSGSADKLVQFKRWFWGVVHHLGATERQELLYFWTGSPSLPASEDGFQPMPTITIRPPDDQHLPSANTCISRLYVPLYTSRQILKQKLSLAIKTKNFGFV